MKGGFDYGEERRRRMTREEELDWLCRLKSEICTCMPKNWKNMSTALDMAIKELEQEHFTVDSKPIVHAHWDVIDEGSEGDEAFVHVWDTLCCSRCGMERTTEDGYIPQYCESCGAKMYE